MIKKQTTNDVVKEIIASNKDGKTYYDGIIIQNVYDYGGEATTKKTANDLYITFNSNQFKALDNKRPTTDSDIRYSLDNDENESDGSWDRFIEDYVKPINPNDISLSSV